MIIEMIQAFGLIFIAEMGDKSQILAMTFASKYKLRHVFVGLFFGILLNHILAVLLGSNLERIVPIETLSISAGVLFILFGLWTLSFDDEEVNTINKYGPVITVMVAFFLGELGDKTQLTTIALSSDATYPLFVLFGTVSGMMFTSLIGIYVGIKLGSNIPEYTIKVVSSVVFILFGGLKLSQSISLGDINTIYIAIVVITILGVYAYRFRSYTKEYNMHQLSAYKQAAKKLHTIYQLLATKMESICLGHNTCGSCSGNSCLIGYTKNIIKQAEDGEEVNFNYLTSPTSKHFDQDKVKEALSLINNELKEDWNNPEKRVLHQVRENLEVILFGELIQAKTYKHYQSIILQKKELL